MNNITKQQKTQERRYLRFLEKLKETNNKVKILGKYEMARIKIEVECLVCGNIWNVVPYSLLKGCGCPECRKEKLSLKFRKDHDYFIEEMKERNPFVKVIGDYVNSKTNILCRCDEHGEWRAQPTHLLNGTGCPKCGDVKTSDAKRKTHEYFIEQMKSINSGIYFSDKYKSDSENMECKCLNCQQIWQATPSNLLRGTGCPKCKESRGEKEITKVLEEYDIDYRSQYRIKECRNLKPLPFDFAVFNNDRLEFLIEYDGEQHFRHSRLFGDEGRYFNTLRNDIIKDEFCKEEKIKLVRIKYDQFKNIKSIIKKELKKHKLLKSAN